MMDSLAGFYEEIARRCDADALESEDIATKWALFDAGNHFRAKAKILRTVTNARALSE